MDGCHAGEDVADTLSPGTGKRVGGGERGVVDGGDLAQGVPVVGIVVRWQAVLWVER